MHVRLYHVTWVPPLTLRPALCWWTAKASTPAQRGPYVTPKQDEVLFFTLYAGFIVLPVHVYQCQAIPKCDLKTHWVKCWTNTKQHLDFRRFLPMNRQTQDLGLKKKKRWINFSAICGWLYTAEHRLFRVVAARGGSMWEWNHHSTLLFFCFPFVFYFVYMDIWLTLTHSCDIPEACIFWQARLPWKKMMI